MSLPKTAEEWEKWAAEKDAAAKVLGRLIVSIAGAVALTGISLLGLWNQVMDTRRDTVENAHSIATTKANTIINNSRLDEAGAPPPEPKAVAEAAHVVATEAPPTTLP